ncbi:hypothetical protein MUN82_08980 [Hymenobacter aerilatus]|uniref:Uncharacterized protein n=1 Tax=Hymenobacter aerilatus TaxID=2932251 RepID=A0A8T9T024_9BACT|nr:hypothetical protein [Hymenobacter aerilatus]UOR07217.1 hypothetical protein MUN82_08980 [Hymenobacter aerilatus]
MSTTAATANHDTIGLESLPTTPGTLKKLSAHISAHRAGMSYERLDYLGLVRSMLQDELRKPAARRVKMQELSRRAFNLDSIIVEKGGAVSSVLIAL